uniref:Uncharacterized protein n=1 Tax=Caenorhabditis japonica TaxID=281687 RepID=A0A8R1HMZ6_CAEJA
MTHLENDFVSGLKTKFQKERVVILSEFINVFDFLNTSKCNERVDSYQKVINTRKVLVKHNFDLKNQLRIIQFNTRKNPFVHFGSITKLKTSATNILSKVDKNLASRLCRCRRVIKQQHRFSHSFQKCKI